MPTAEALIPTTNARRYLAQLCDHLGHLQHGAAAHRHGGDHSPPAVLGIDRSGETAQIQFDWGHCQLSAAPDALNLQVRADAEDNLARGKELLARRLETIGHRERLTVTWQPADGG